MKKNWITAAKSVVVTLVAGAAIWTVGGAAAHTLAQDAQSDSTSTTVVADPGNWGVVAPVN